MKAVVLPCLALSVFAVTASAQVPAGPEFQVNTQTLYAQFDPSTAHASNGDFVVVWTSRVNPPSDYDVFGQRYTAAGARVGGEFRANAYVTGMQRMGRVAVDRDGDFVVVWQSLLGQDGIFGRRFDRSGTAIGSEFRIDTPGGYGTAPVVAMDSPGNFVVAWWGDGPGDLDGVFARRVSADGVPLGSDFRVNTYTTGSQRVPSVAIGPAGDFVVAWNGTNQDGSSYGIFGQRFSANGAPLGGEFAVNEYTTGAQWLPSVAVDARGGFVVAWGSEARDGQGWGVAAQRFSADGTRMGSELVVNSYTTGQQDGPTARIAPSGAFVITWNSGNQDGSSYGVFGQRFHSGGARRGAEFRVNTYTSGTQATIGGLSLDRVGNVTIAWDSVGQDGSDRGIHAQRLGGLVPIALRLDPGNAVLEPGEGASVRPTWRNVNGVAQTFGGRLSAFAGPLPGGMPIVLQPDGNYGTVADGAEAECVQCYGIAIADPVPRPATHWDAVVMERIQPDALGQDKLWSLHIGRSFDDVPPASSFYPFIETLLHHGVTAGCSPTTYCPAASTTRAQMAVFLLVAMEGTGYSPVACTTPVFSDVPASSPFCRWIEELARRGITGGCGNANYCPSSPVSREQMAVFVLRTLEPTLNPPACGIPMFADVPAASPFCRWIEELTRRNVVTGCGGGNYCPSAHVTREQMGVFISETFGLILYGP